MLLKWSCLESLLLSIGPTFYGPTLDDTEQGDQRQQNSETRHPVRRLTNVKLFALLKGRIWSDRLQSFLAPRQTTLEINDLVNHCSLGDMKSRVAS